MEDREEGGGNGVEEDLFLCFEGNAILEVGVNLLLQSFLELETRMDELG